AQLEGMKILRRRFENLFPSCKVTVNSGTVTPEGEWDAKREKPLTSDNPGIYMMEWDAPQQVRGLAIKEIDGRFTEIDAWTGDGSPDMKADKGWEKLATYEQPLRYYYHPDQNNNTAARYMDGYVDFGREVSTRAIRMRVTEQWMWKGEGRDALYGVRRDRGGMDLDPTRCRIYGVAPLKAVGGDSPVDLLATQRIEVYDLATKKLVKEIPFPQGSDIAFAPDGSLYGISPGKVVKVDVDLAVDGKGQLWVTECDWTPKRVSLWGVDGTFKKDMLGPTEYGGRGVLDPHDKSRVYFTTQGGGGLEFALDWKTGATALKNVLWLGNAQAGEQPLRIKDRQYLVTRPLFLTQPVGIVYLQEKDRLKLAAAMGAAGSFPPLRTAEILEKLGRKALGEVAFVWSDRSGDGSPQANEVEFFDMPNRQAAADADGKAAWTHPIEGWGVHALLKAKKPWFPGQAVALFDVVGHE
ncbi:MAG: hypothetical protein ACKOHG_14435, partial [Planctomycetia bacterium]